ncbi:MAG: hypothetical protein ACRBCI_15090, partial [Cellvibrionaceae bacterium]
MFNPLRLSNRFLAVMLLPVFLSISLAAQGTVSYPPAIGYGWGQYVFADATGAGSAACSSTPGGSLAFLDANGEGENTTYQLFCNFINSDGETGTFGMNIFFSKNYYCP